MSINPTDPHVRYTKIISYSNESKQKQSDDLYLHDGIGKWVLSYNVNELGKVIVKATKTFESTKYNDESKIEFTIETKEKKTPRIKKKKYYDKQGNEINDEQLLKDIANGMNVISYTEVKSGKERTVVKKMKYCRR